MYMRFKHVPEVFCATKKKDKHAKSNTHPTIYYSITLHVHGYPAFQPIHQDTLMLG